MMKVKKIFVDDFQGHGFDGGGANRIIYLVTENDQVFESRQDHTYGKHIQTPFIAWEKKTQEVDGVEIKMLSQFNVKTYKMETANNYQCVVVDVNFQYYPVQYL